MADHVQVFREMCEKHDLTYDFSDDGSVWRRGLASETALRLYAKEHLSPEERARIWNEVVDTKLIEGHRERFYWKE